MSTAPPIPMIAPDGSFHWIPNGVISQAVHAGGKPALRITDPQGVQRWIPQDVAHEALQHGAKLVPVQDYPKPTMQSADSGFLSSAVAPLVGAAKGLFHAATDKPQGKAETAVNFLGPGALFLKRTIVDPAIEQGKEAIASGEAAWNEENPYRRHMDESEAVGHGLAAITPGAGPWAASVGEKEGQQIGERNYAGAAGTAVGNVALALVPKMAEKTVGPITRGLKEKVASARENFGSSPKTVRELVKNVKKENVATDKANAEFPEKRKEYEQRLAVTEAENNAKIAAHEEDVKTTTEANARAMQEHEQAVQVVDAENAEKMSRYKDDVQAVKEENAQAQAGYEAAKNEADQIEKAAKEQQSKRGQLARQIQQRSARLVERLKSVQEKWKDSTALQKTKGYQPTGILDRAFDKIRKATAGAESSSSALASAVQKAQSKIAGSTENLKIFKDILSKNPEDDPEFVTLHEAGGKTQIPKGHALYDVLKEGEAEGANPPTWKDLQGYYTEIGRSISSGNLPGDVYQALRSLQDDIGNQMQEMANSRGVGSLWKLTRAQYRDYMQTFRESAGPNHSGSPIAQALNAKDPAYAIKPLTVEETAQRVRNALSRFDPAQNGQGGAASLFDNLRADYRAFDGMEAIKPTQEPSAPIVKQEPEAPSLKPRPVPPTVKPEPIYPSLAEKPTAPAPPKPLRKIGVEDIRAKKAENLEKYVDTAQKHIFWWSTVWPAFRSISDLAHGEMPGIETATPMAAGAMVNMALDRIFQKPGVIDFFTRATPNDIAQVPEDLRGDLPQIVKTAQSRGVKVSPALAALVGAGNAIGPKTRQLQQSRDHTRFRMVATNPQGHRIGSNDGGVTWVDTETGERVHAQ